MKKYFNYGNREEELLDAYEKVSGDTIYKEDAELRELKLQELKYLDEMVNLEHKKPSIINALLKKEKSTNEKD